MQKNACWLGTIEEGAVMMTSSGVFTVPPGSWRVLHQRRGPLPHLSCLVWPCLSSHHTAVRTAHSVPPALFIVLRVTLHHAEAFFRSPNSLLSFYSGAQPYSSSSSSASASCWLVSCTCTSHGSRYDSSSVFSSPSLSLGYLNVQAHFLALCCEVGVSNSGHFWRLLLAVLSVAQCSCLVPLLISLSIPQCFPGCLTIQIRTVLCIFIVLLIYAVAQACVVSGGKSKRKMILNIKENESLFCCSKALHRLCIKNGKKDHSKKLRSNRSRTLFVPLQHSVLDGSSCVLISYAVLFHF